MLECRMFFAAIAVPHRFDMWLPPVSHAQYHPSTHLSIYPFPLQVHFSLLPISRFI